MTTAWKISIAVLVALATVIGVTTYVASETTSTRVSLEVRVWQPVDSDELYLSVRPPNGTWTTENSPLYLDTLHESGGFRHTRSVIVTTPITLAGPEPPVVTGDWEYFEGAHTGGEYVGYQLQAIGTDESIFGTSQSLVLRCTSGDTQAIFFATDEWLRNDRETGLTEVQYRLFGGAQQTAYWPSDEEFNSTLWAAPFDQFASQLRAATGVTLYLSVFGDDGFEDYSASFNIAGVRNVLDKLPCF